MSLGLSDPDLEPVIVSFIGCNNFVVERNRSYYADARAEDSNGVPKEVLGIESMLPLVRSVSEICQFIANQTSPRDDKAMRRQRKKERELFGKWWQWDGMHFVKIVNYYPTPERSLQGLWKGISEDMILQFYLVTYDDVSGITCQRVGQAGEIFLGYSPVFWTSNTTFLESPFFRKEHHLYGSSEHICPLASNWRSIKSEVVSCILYVKSIHSLVIPNLSGSSSDTSNVDGRIWAYDDGTFGFGFLQDHYIIVLKHITLNGSLDTVENFYKHSTL